MTKILPTQDDYEAENITEFLSSPDVSLSEKQALLEDPAIQDIANRLDSEARIDGSVPHMMERWQQTLRDEENGISGTKSVPTAKNTKPLPAKPNIAEMFFQNEADEGVAKVVAMQKKPAAPVLGKRA